MQVVLLGATRSGTSVTAGVLHRLGISMGSDLVPPDDRNPTGFFEDRDFLDLNRRILGEAGGDFIHPPTHDRILAQQPRFQSDIAELVRRRDASYRVWGWKTTNTCLTLDLFLPELRDPRLVVLFRNPLAVARSQAAFSPGELEIVDALQLVETYYSRVFDALERHPEVPVLFASYEDLVRNARSVADEMAAFLQLSASPTQVRWAAALVTGRRGLRVEQIKLAGRSWRLLQVRRLRRARQTLRGDGVAALAGRVVQRLRGS